MNVQSNVDETCPICYHALENETHIMHNVNNINTKVCMHRFCQSCIVGWFLHCSNNEINIRCPMCRRSVNI